MKLRISRRKQFSFLPVSVSLNGSPFKPLVAGSAVEFETSEANGNLVLNLYGLKREFVIPLNPQPVAEMSFKIDRNQKTLLFLSIIGCIFLMFAGILNKNITQILVASGTFIAVALYSVYYAMHLETTTRTE